jgi:hypothetical protein
VAIQRRQNLISQERIDVPTMRGIESAVSNDFDQSIQAFITGAAGFTQSNSNPGIGYIIRGFEVLMSGAIGGAASSLQLSVDPGALMNVNSSQSGTVYMVPPGTPNQQLSSATNPSVVNGAFVPNSLNYVGLDYIRFADSATDQQDYLWNPTSNTETTTVAPGAIILTYNIYVTTTPWASNVMPIAIVETNAGNLVTSITDCRWLLFRLATGGADPNPFYQYPWPETQVENPSTSTSNGVNPFYGGDKAISTLKDWMNAIMTSIEQIQGTNYWYSAISQSGSLITLREDVANTVVTGNTTISNGVLPNTTPVLSTTGNTHSNNQLDGLASTTGIVPGQLIIGSGLPSNTTVLSISGSTVTMSANAVTTLTGVSVAFYAPEQVTVPGQINWASNPPGDGFIYFKLIGSRLSYQIVENPTGASVTLADNEVAYLNLTRNVNVAPQLIYTPGSGITVVTSVGSVVWTTSLQAGDFIRAQSDSDANYYKIQSVDSPSQVTLTGIYTPVGAATGVTSVYAFGVYTLPGETGTQRDIQLADRSAVPLNGNTVWLFLRSDDGGSVARVYIKFLGAELQDGDSQEISGPTLNNVLQYIGSPIESAVAPNYTSAIYPGALPEITQITTPAASAMASNEYFYQYSSGNYRKYYVWVNKDGTGVDPMPFADYIGIPWIVSTGQTATQTATALVNALNGIIPNDFLANSSSAVVTVKNNSGGITNPSTNFNVSGLSISVTQVGTGIGNAVINDGDNLTLAIKKLDDEFGNFINSLDSPTYDETINIVTSGGQTPPYFGSGAPNYTPVTLNGPISSTTDVTLPSNTRLGNIPQAYTVGKGTLEVYLNGQFQELGIDWLEVGAFDTASTQIETLRTYVVGDYIQFRIGTGGGGGGGGGVGPPGPTGPQGAPGADAAGGPININTYTGLYTVLLTNCFLKANCASGPVTFTLPAASSAAGRIFYFNKIDSTTNAMIINPNGSDLIDGANTLTTTVQYTAYSLISDGSTWSIF